MYEDVLERGDLQARRVDLELLGTLERLVVDRAALRIEDQVDQDIVVVGFQQPAFRRILGMHARLRECVACALGVRRPHEEIDVVLRLRPAARPAGQTAAEDERHAGVLQRARRLLHRLEQPLEVSLWIAHHLARFPAGAEGGTFRP